MIRPVRAGRRALTALQGRSARVLLVAVALILPISAIAYFQVNDLNAAARGVHVEGGGVACLRGGYAVLRALSALEVGTVGARATVDAGLTRFAASDCPERAVFARVSHLGVRDRPTRRDVVHTLTDSMKEIAQATNLTYDTSPITVDATASSAYELAEALPLLAFAAATPNRIDAAKIEATAQSRLKLLDNNVALLLDIGPWTRGTLLAPRARQAARFEDYFALLDRWEQQPAGPRLDVHGALQASFEASDALFAALTQTIDANLEKEREQIDRRRTLVIATAAGVLAVALAIVWLFARRVMRRHRGEIDRLNELARKQARFQAVFVGSPLPIAITDLEGTVLESNQAYLALVGLPFVQAGCTPLFAPARLGNPLDISSLLRPLREGRATSTHLEVTVTRNDESPLCCHAAATLVRTPGNAAVYCVVTLQDVTERQLRDRRLHHESTHDALTGIFNRAFLIDRLECHMERPEAEFALLFIDVDDFKTINDTLGHAAGDACLRAIAERLQTLVRAGDVVARFGGDEFAVLLCDPDTVENIDAVCARLRADVAAPIAFEDCVLHVSSSIGFALGGTVMHAGAAAVIAAADRAMYADKARAASRAVTIRSGSAH